MKCARLEPDETLDPLPSSPKRRERIYEEVFRFISSGIFLIAAGFEASSAHAVTRHRKAKYVGNGALGGAAIGALAGGGKGALIGAGAGAGAGYMAQCVTSIGIVAPTTPEHAPQDDAITADREKMRGQGS
jgi:hypothetical protein